MTPVPDQYQPPATRNEEMDMNRSVVAWELPDGAQITRYQTKETL